MLQKQKQEVEENLNGFEAKATEIEDSETKSIPVEEMKTPVTEKTRSKASTSSVKSKGQKVKISDNSSTHLVRISTSPEQQNSLMEESGKMLEYLRKEVLKLRKENYSLKRDLERVHETTQRLLEANAVAHDSFSSLNETAKEQRLKSKSVITELKQEVFDLKTAQEEMKDEVNMKQAAYVAEVRSRKCYEAGLSRLVELIQTKCRDRRLVEAVLQISDEIEEEQHRDPEAEIKSEAVKEAEDTKLPESVVGRFASFFT